MLSRAHSVGGVSRGLLNGVLRGRGVKGRGAVSSSVLFGHTHPGSFRDAGHRGLATGVRGVTMTLPGSVDERRLTFYASGSEEANLDHMEGRPSAKRQGPMDAQKYAKIRPVSFDDCWTERRWPSRSHSVAPVWCSVDLRDGNHSLRHPMSSNKRLLLFKHLVDIGIQEIEVGFPGAARGDKEFIRRLIDTPGLVDRDVWLTVVSDPSEASISEMFDATAGAPRVIWKLLSGVRMDERGLTSDEQKSSALEAVKAATRLMREERDRILHADAARGVPGPLRCLRRLEITPEFFSSAELAFSRDLVMDVLDVWAGAGGGGGVEGSAEVGGEGHREEFVEDDGEDMRPIVNLAASVELSPPNVFADCVEWFISHLGERRRQVAVSVHPHNDRGTAVAAAEMALLAGADRVEGCLFGNGERAGNLDLVCLAVNLFSGGVNPVLDLSDLPSTVEVSEYCTEISLHDRHPWAGALVFTSFSGPHKDKVWKGLKAHEQRETQRLAGGTQEGAEGPNQWSVPYLPVDPKDLGRSYECLVRPSMKRAGHSGIAFLMEKEFGVLLPREMQVEFLQLVKTYMAASGLDPSMYELWEVFRQKYLLPTSPVCVLEFRVLLPSEAKTLSSEIPTSSFPQRSKAKGEAERRVRETQTAEEPPEPVFEPDALQEDLMERESEGVQRETPQQSEGSGFTGENILGGEQLYDKKGETEGSGGETETETKGGQKEEREIVTMEAKVELYGEKLSIRGEGNGPLEALLNGLNPKLPTKVDIMRYYAHAIGKGAGAEAVVYVQVRGRPREGMGQVKRFGVGIEQNTSKAAIKATMSAINHLLRHAVPSQPPVEFRIPAKLGGKDRGRLGGGGGGSGGLRSSEHGLPSPFSTSRRSSVEETETCGRGRRSGLGFHSLDHEEAGRADLEPEGEFGGRRGGKRQKGDGEILCMNSVSRQERWGDVKGGGAPEYGSRREYERVSELRTDDQGSVVSLEKSVGPREGLSGPVDFDDASPSPALGRLSRVCVDTAASSGVFPTSRSGSFFCPSDEKLKRFCS
uniref:2-isopropylmalate synthase n=1 Tax=Chromera velia CCMP2878 TaxID=1169474 RepID=A0A0G4I1M1_9ALVE|eukprot:Cvel_10177.t1-p1 / transcript=Cvel_10177.t1 / gene=Cvel_10177 / organism=Chromera_velia_CCMP2878 / gene_product=2-isopropylmalate synthase, putative / transcript_product=2-isopropylmalate synthase, putative / location=Cvel_scaffold607:67667-75830(+) / protein_length=1035 / sequence_SO=supercontig / SO=protein_coding / is_pseudo=false